MNEMTDCRKFDELLQPYLDNELEIDDRMQFEAHVRACPECGRTLAEMTSILTGCAELDEGLVMPLDAQAAWRKAVRVEAAKRRRGVGFVWVRTASAIAAVLVVLVGGTMVVNRLPSLNPNDTGINNTMTEVQYAYDTFNAAETMSAAGALMDLGTSKNFAPQMDGAVEVEMESEADLMSVSVMPESGSDPSISKTDIKLIRSASRQLETIDFDNDVQVLKDLVSEYEGIIEYDNGYGQKITPENPDGRWASLNCRIPTASFDEFLTSLDAVGTTISRNESSEDISMQYYDVQTRLNTQKALRDRLQSMIVSAQTVEDMISIESKLSEVQSEIEYMEGRIKGWDGQISYSFVSLSMHEVADKNAVKTINPTTLSERIKISFTASINMFLSFLQDMAVFLVLVWPWLVILIIVIIILCAVIRRRNR